MCFGRTEEIHVEPNSEYVIWEIPVQGIKAKKVILRVANGCQAICYVNGGAHLYETGKHELMWRKALNSGNQVSLMGVNRAKVFKFNFGVGHIPFYDIEADYTVEVGIHGDCEFTVFDGESICSAFGGVRSVSPKDINEKLFLKFQEYLKSELSKVLERYDYHTIDQSVSDLSKAVEKCFKEEFLKDGVLISRCSVSGTVFPQDYAQERQERIEAKKNKREKERDKKEELEFLKRLSKTDHSQPENNASLDQKTIFCPRCGQKNEAGTKYCKFCGIKF